MRVMTLGLKKVGAIDMGVGCLYNLLHSEKERGLPWKREM